MQDRGTKNGEHMDDMKRKGPSALRMLALAGVALGTLAACTNGKFNSNPLFDLGLRAVGLADTPAAPEARESIGPPLIVGYNDIRVAIPGVGDRGQSAYFIAPDGVEIAMNGKFVTRVIGLGIDLEGMYLPIDSPYVGDFIDAARNRDVTSRVAEYYRKGRVTRDSYKCALTVMKEDGDKGVISERCRRFFDDEGFENRYWFDEGRIICSVQWFHPQGDVLQFFETAAQATSLDLRRQGC
jgi:hypothetical protein